MTAAPPLPAPTTAPVPASAPGRWRRVAGGPAAARLPALLVLLALPLVRPNLFGEFASVGGFGLLALAAGIAVAVRAADPGAAARPRSGIGPALVMVLLLGLAYLWLLVQAAGTDPAELGRPALQGLVLTVGALLALAVVCADPRARLAVARVFVLVLVVLCVSYVVTALVWAVAGLGTGELLRLPIGTATEPQPVYLPFTPTLGSQTVFGATIPRFTGLGREPGWMAMYCAAAFFLTDAVGWRSRWLKAALLAGLVGCVSTAGFGVFVVACTYHVFLRDRGTGISMAGFLRHVLGLAAIAGAVWLAVAAPVLGLAAKTTQNAISLDERQLATEAGLRALGTHPLGGIPTEVQAAVNLIGDLAVDGLPFVLLVVAALLVPPALRGGPARFGNAAVLVVFLTLLTSQPPRDSTWAYAVVLLSVTLAAQDMEPLVPTRTSYRRRTNRRAP